MNSLLLVSFAAIGYLAAYRLYGRFIGNKIFNLTVKNKTPSHVLQDNVDYVPTRKSILFGHHFTTIAGLGPIIGPAIGIIWGWLPAFIWIFLGSVFMGAVHDFAVLVISSKNKGKSLGELTGDIIHPSTRYAFQFLIQFLLMVVLAVFAMIVGLLFTMYPYAVFPVWMQIPIAVWLGIQIRKGKNELLYSVIALALLYCTIVAGLYLPIHIPALWGAEVSSWVLIIFVYVFFASTIPVHKLLQPRDYINSHQLSVTILLLLLGLVIAHPPITAPAINSAAMQADSDIPSLMPLLFITIACGAISGFHSLASSGTTVKQIDNEKDALFIGYGSMIWESFLALIVLMAVAAGLGMGMQENGVLFKGVDAFHYHYSSWTQASGLDAKLKAFVTGGANLMNSYGISKEFAESLIAVFIVSFANTTLDSATRIQRLSLQEICGTSGGRIKKLYSNRYFATFVVVAIAAALAFTNSGGTGALVLWPLFGALNQLLAALALGMVSIYLYKNGKNILYAMIPMIFVLFITVWAMIDNLVSFWPGELLLFFLSAMILILTVWLLATSIRSLLNKN